MRRHIRTGGAVILGIALVAVAILYTPKEKQSIADSKEALLVAETPSRSYIPTKDSDGDGRNDWEEQFVQLETPQAPPTATSTTYTPPNTATGRFAIQFFEDYLSARASAGSKERIGDQQKKALVERNISSIGTPPNGRYYIEQALTLSDNSTAALHDYGNELASALLVFYSKDKKNETNVLGDYLTTKDERVLDQLVPILITYQQLVQDLLATPVPPQLADQHLQLVNLTQSVYEDVSTFQQANKDPLLLLVYINQYQEDISAITNAFYSVSEQLFTAGVRYESSEPGARAIKKFDINHNI